MVGKVMAQEMALKTNLLYDATTTIHLGYEVALSDKITLDIWANYNPWTLGHKYVNIHNYTGTTRPTATADNGIVYSSGESYSERRASKLKHFMLQPELRWWTCEKFNGHFFGAHLHGGLFDVGALTLPFGWGDYDNDGVKSKDVYFREQVGGQYQYYKGTEYKLASYPSSYPDKQTNYYNGYYNADRDGIYTNSFEGWFIGLGVSYGYHWVIAPRFSMEFTIGVGYAYLNYDKTRCTDCKVVIDKGESTHYVGPTRAGISLIYMLK